MSEPINDGGPAFPVIIETMWISKGMTLRDWFAGQALVGWNAIPDHDYSFRWENAQGELRFLGYGSTPARKDIEGWRITKTPREAMAEEMYAQADAMIAARAKKP